MASSVCFRAFWAASPRQPLARMWVSSPRTRSSTVWSLRSRLPSCSSRAYCKCAAVLTSIPQPVIGGATIGVFATIGMNGVVMFARHGLSQRDTTLMGLSIAFGTGIERTAGALAGTGFPAWLTPSLADPPLPSPHLSPSSSTWFCPAKNNVPYMSCGEIRTV